MEVNVLVLVAGEGAFEDVVEVDVVLTFTRGLGTNVVVRLLVGVVFSLLRSWYCCRLRFLVTFVLRIVFCRLAVLVGDGGCGTVAAVEVDVDVRVIFFLAEVGSSVWLRLREALVLICDSCRRVLFVGLGGGCCESFVVVEVDVFAGDDVVVRSFFLFEVGFLIDAVVLVVARILVGFFCFILFCEVLFCAFELISGDVRFWMCVWVGGLFTSM